MLHALNLRGQALESLGHLECANDDLVHDIASMTYALGREGASRDDQAIRANDPKDADAQLIGARPVMAIKEQDLEDGIIQLDCFKPPAKPHNVPRMHKTSRPCVSLACIDRHEAHIDQAAKNPFGRNERIPWAHTLVR